MKIETAIELLQEMIGFWEFLMSIENDDKYTTSLELEALRLAVQALKSSPRWIPCSERPPEMHEKVDYTGRYEESDFVLICDAAELHPQMHVARCVKIEDRTWWRTREWRVLSKVTAWMPLPETYSGEV